MPSKLRVIIFLFLLTSLYLRAQDNKKNLQKLDNTSLFNPVDTTCIKVTGEWLGEEIQYDPTKSFIKVKFKVVFKLQQEGNRVYGTSYIEDKFRGSYGDMKIRGLVSGNKLYFEEYEIVDEKFYEKNVVWCLRSGELAIKNEGDKLVLQGLQYDGYASDTYKKCTDYVTMSLSKNTNAQQDANTKPKAISANDGFDVLAYPNPCTDHLTLTYQLKMASKVELAVFSLSGALLQSISNDNQSGEQHQQLNLSAYTPGIYVIRLISNSGTATKQIVKSR